MSQEAPVRGPLFEVEDLVEIFKQWKQGAIGEAHAVKLVRQRAASCTVDAALLIPLSNQCVRWCYQDHLVGAQMMQRLLTEALQTDPVQYRTALPSIAAHHLRIATSSLWKHADATVYERAVALGDEGLTVADPLDRATIAHELGILHLDPYFASRTPADQKRWWYEAKNASGALPEPQRALELARVWLERALTLFDQITGLDRDKLAVARLQTLKALVQTLCSAPIVGLARDDNQVKRLLTQAAPLLSAPINNPSIAVYLRTVADALGVSISRPGVPESVLDVDWPARAKEIGIEVVASIVLPYLRSAQQGKRIADGLSLARRVRDLFDEAPDGLRTAYLDATATLLAHSSAFEKLYKLASADREDDALRELKVLPIRFPELADWSDALDFLGYQLLVGSAVNAIRARRFGLALQRYCLVVRLLVDLRCYRSAVDMLDRAADVMTGADEVSATALCELVREAGVPWSQDVITAWQEGCQKAAQAAIGPLTATPLLDGWFAILRLAKGPSYADQCLSTVRYDWRVDSQGTQLFKDIVDLERDAATSPRRIESTTLYEHALVSYRAASNEAAGATAGERRDLLAARLDVHVRGRLAALPRQTVEHFAVSQVQGALDERTVLLDLYYPPYLQEYVYCIAMTRDNAKLFVTRLPPAAGAVSATGDTGMYWSSRAGLAIADLRRLVQEEPEPGQLISPAARRELPGLSRLLLGGVFEWLDEQSQYGRDHLIIVPDGPGHFVPYALLDAGNGPLADRWTVTTLPSIDLLRRARRPGPPRAASVACGLGYTRSGKALGVPPLVHAPAEASAVARAMNVPPIVEEEATPQRLLRAFVDARYLHLACHGEHDVVGSTLQSLILTPGAGDGRLRHLDVLALQLDGLELVSLSACETGLGRIDLGGNPLGIATSLIAGGAAAVVTTLWPVADDAAALFFSDLYARVIAGEPRRAAWRGALAKTRSSFPEYRDWGAFHPSGYW